MKAFLNCLIISQHENRTSGNKNRIRRYRYTDFSLILYCKNIYIISSSNIQFSNRSSNPFIWDCYFKDRMRRIYFHIVKDMIIRGGENIYPLEIENFLLGMPGVLDAQVVGIPDEKLGEIVGAFIRTRPGYEDMTEEDVREYSIPRIARYKVPKRVFFVDEFPMTPSMKIQKFKLRDMAVQMLEERNRV